MKNIIVRTILFLYLFMSSLVYLNIVYALENKVVYLTFDDGPNCEITPKILDILSDNNISATFFVVGENVKKNTNIMQRIKSEGNAVMPHTYCHEFKKIYSSYDDFFKDLAKCEVVIRESGISNKLNFIRIPGGMNNEYCSKIVLNEIKQQLLKKGKTIIDWTVDSGDTLETNVSFVTIKNNLENYSGIYDVEVVLMHDLADKEITVENLNWIIDFYRTRGYKFKNLGQITESEIEYLKSINVIGN